MLRTDVSIALSCGALREHWRILQGSLMSSAIHFHSTWTQLVVFLEYRHTCTFNITKYVLSVLREVDLLTRIQCIILATRPLLFCFLKIRFESPESCMESINASRNVRNLMQMCLESAQHSTFILSSLQSQGLLGKTILGYYRDVH